MQTHVHPAGWRTYNLWLCERPHRPSLWSTESVLINWNNVRRGSEWPWLWPECLIPLFGRDDPINKKLRVVKRGGSSNSRIKYAIRVCIRIWWPMMIMYTNWPHVNAVYCIWEWSAPYTRQETSLERPSVCAWIESSLTGWWLFCSDTRVRWRVVIKYARLFRKAKKIDVMTLVYGLVLCECKTLYTPNRIWMSPRE